MTVTCLFQLEPAFVTPAVARVRNVVQGDPGDGDLAPQPGPSKASGVLGPALEARGTAGTVRHAPEVTRSHRWRVMWAFVSRILRVSVR